MVSIERKLIALDLVETTLVRSILVKLIKENSNLVTIKTANFSFENGFQLLFVQTY